MNQQKTLNQNKTLKSFVAFYAKNPNLRFWQALRAWTKAEYIFIQKYNPEVDDETLEDTYYFKNKNK